MKKFKEFIRWFVYITPCILILCATILTIQRTYTISVWTLWQILLASLVTAFATPFLTPKERDTKVKFLVGCIPHYLSLCFIMTLLGFWVGWISISFTQALLMCIYVAIVYVGILGINFLINKRDADIINRKLKRKYKD